MLHWKTKNYMHLHEAGRFSGSGNSQVFTVVDAENRNTIMMVPSEATTFLEMAWTLISKADALIWKDIEGTK